MEKQNCMALVISKSWINNWSIVSEWGDLEKLVQFFDFDKATVRHYLHHELHIFMFEKRKKFEIISIFERNCLTYKLLPEAPTCYAWRMSQLISPESRGNPKLYRYHGERLIYGEHSDEYTSGFSSADDSYPIDKPVAYDEEGNPIWKKRKAIILDFDDYYYEPEEHPTHYGHNIQEWKFVNNLQLNSNSMENDQSEKENVMWHN